VFVVRPIAGMIAMAGSSQPLRERLLLSFLGIRGVGSVYYVAYGLNHGNFGDSERLWAVVGFIVLVSILVHGVTAAPLLQRLARRRKAAAG
jgi:NhaP-type Na+/H+ or K+/H+ antiporter